MFCIVFYIPFILKYKITSKYLLDTNRTEYYFNNTKFHKTKLAYYHLYIHEFLRDIVPIIILFIINIFTLNSLRKTTKRRKSISKFNQSSVNKVKKIEMNKIKMIFVTSLLYSLHLPIFISNIGLLKNSCFKYLSYICLDFSYSILIVSYFLFTNKFRIYFTKPFIYLKCNFTS